MDWITKCLADIPGAAYAAEVGSRARGTFTEHSDHDVFVVVVRHPTEYLSILPPPETEKIDRECEGRKIEIVVWDIYKTLKLFSQSNMSVIDALCSPLAYLDTGIGESLRELLRSGFYSPIAIIGHCMGMAKKATAERNHSPKRLLSSVYSVLRARWAEKENGIPPMNIDELDPRALYSGEEQIFELVEHLKSAVRNRETEVPQKYVLIGLEFIEREYQRLRHFRQERRIQRVPSGQLDKILFSQFVALYPETKDMFGDSICFHRLSVQQPTR